MKALTILAALLLCVVALSCSSSKKSLEADVPLTPYTKFYRLDGSTMIYDELKGKTAAILFWAAWCNFSKRAVRHFNDEAKRFQGRSDVVFLAVSIDDDRALLLQRIGQDKLNSVTHVFSGNGPDDEAYLAFKVREIPAAVLVKPSGDIMQQGSRIDLSEVR